MSQTNFAIAITRTCGSGGGSYVGKKLAADYGIDLYDRIAYDRMTGSGEFQIRTPKGNAETLRQKDCAMTVFCRVRQ